jgi:two-component system, sensor histidine kinase and response regulator
MSDPSPSAVTANRSKVIVGVDDADDSRKLLDRVVSDAGYTYLGVASGQECLTLLARTVPRLILLDIQMPDMDGFETCRRLRAYKHLIHVPIAFLTARKTTEDVRKGMAAGGNVFIVKPFDPAKLAERLHYWTRHQVNRAW